LIYIEISKVRALNRWDVLCAIIKGVSNAIALISPSLEAYVLGGIRRLLLGILLNIHDLIIFIISVDILI